MNKKAIFDNLRIYFRNMCILAIFFLFFNCMGGLPARYSSENDEFQLLVAAGDAFRKKSFLKAEELFEKLYEEANGHDVRRIALYGLACTRFVLADNEDELDHALNLWYSWYKSPSETIPREDPRMMVPVFEKMISRRWTFTAVGEKTLTDEASEKPIRRGYGQNVSESLVDKQADEEFDYEKPQAETKQVPFSGTDTSSSGVELQYLLESREKEILKLRQQLGSMEKSIKSLKNQIHAIEEIHQEIFEKKKGMHLR